jgi:deoxyribonuclease V
MLLCLDVHYEDHGAVTACIGFSAWPDAESTLELVVRSDTAPQPYEPGRFYKRELPHLLATVQEVRRRRPIEAVLIDGHVWLDAGRPGLAGTDAASAAMLVQGMHGPHRIPTLIARADRLARGHERPDPAKALDK